MNISMVTLVAGDNYSKAVGLATLSKRDYCRFHGYPLVVGNDSDVDSSRPIPWSKIPLLMRALPHYDFLFWSDADAIIADYVTRLEDFFIDFINSNKNIILTL